MLISGILNSVYYSHIAHEMWRSDLNGIPRASYSGSQKPRRRKGGSADPVVPEPEGHSRTSIHANATM